MKEILKRAIVSIIAGIVVSVLVETINVIEVGYSQDFTTSLIVLSICASLILFFGQYLLEITFVRFDERWK